MKKELIDYVKIQLSKGVTREKITSNLFGRGEWTKKQISEACQYAEQSISTQILSQTSITKNTKWTIVIPRINILSTVISIGLFVNTHGVFNFFGSLTATHTSGVCYLGRAGSEGPCPEYSYLLLVTIIIIVSINYFESFHLAKRYENSSSRLDTWFIVVAILRNFILFLVALPPLMQYLGLLLMYPGGIAHFLAYHFMVRSRNKSIVAV